MLKFVFMNIHVSVEKIYIVLTHSHFINMTTDNEYSPGWLGNPNILSTSCLPLTLK